MAYSLPVYFTLLREMHMRTTLNLILLSLLFAMSGCSFAGNSEAVSIETVEPGVQKVIPLVDRNTFLPNENATAPWYRIYDDQTGEWYPARQDASGEWELTDNGAEMRNNDLESLAEPEEDKITQWRNDTAGFTYSPQLIDTNAEGQGVKAKPTPQLDLERKRTSDTSTAEPAADSTSAEPIGPEPLEQAENAVTSDAATSDGSVTRGIVEEPHATDEADPADVVDAVDYGVGNASDSEQEVAVPADASLLTLEGRAPTWVTAVIDGDGERSFFIRNGQKLDLYFGSSVTLEVGDAPSIDMYLDGEPYTLSPSGKATIRRP